MNIKKLATMAATIIAATTLQSAAYAQDSKCGAGTCGKKEQKNTAKEAACSKKEIACSKKEIACSKKEIACSKKEIACSKKEATQP